VWIADSERSNQIDHKAACEFGLSSTVLMERAGLAVFEALKSLLPEGGRIVVFCGKGKNGGDGLVVSRLAKDANYGVEVLVAATEAELSSEAADQLRAARAHGVQPIFVDDARWERRIDMVACRDLVIDALLGTGARGSVDGPVRQSIQAINRSGVPVIAVDVPSGICCNTGEELGESVWALRTVTFGLPKPFLFEGIGLEHSGYWTVADIGYPQCLLEEPTSARVVDAEWVGSLLPERRKASHKGENGSILIVAGSQRMRGAAILAAKAALRSGAGLVTVASVPAVCDAIAASVPEALTLPLPEANGVIAPEAAQLILDVQSRYHAALFGPGLTHEPPLMDFLGRVWSGWHTPCVIDADALNSVSQGVELPKAECVLTPHPGEMSRLLKCSIAEIQADRFRTVSQAVSSTHQCVLLKGPYSIVGEPGQPMMVNCTGNPGLASGGMGDVLSGIIATLLAQELPSYYAASCGMYWHGAAADLCADEIGTIGYSASDVANALPRARCKITCSCDPR